MPLSNAEVICTFAATFAMHKKTGKDYDSYKCHYCNEWHIGKPS